MALIHTHMVCLHIHMLNAPCTHTTPSLPTCRSGLGVCAPSRMGLSPPDCTISTSFESAVQQQHHQQHFMGPCQRYARPPPPPSFKLCCWRLRVVLLPVQPPGAILTVDGDIGESASSGAGVRNAGLFYHCLPPTTSTTTTNKGGTHTDR